MQATDKLIGPRTPWRLAALALLPVLGTGALAQAVADEESAPPLPVPGQILSDAEPLPAEHRDSSGAVVLHDSRVRAQRSAFQAAGQRTGVTSAIGHNVTRLMERARSWSDVREAEAPDASPPGMPAQAQ